MNAGGTMKEYYLITFKNTHSAISGEKKLKAEGFEVTVIPTPTTLTKSCGISLRIRPGDFERAAVLVKNGDLEAGSIFFKSQEGYKQIELEK
jgi:hypothetical protein